MTEGAFSSLADDASFTSYLDSMGMHPLLTPEEEVQLAREIKQGAAAKEGLEDETARALSRETARALRTTVSRGEAARAKFINSNLRLVLAVAKAYRIPGYSILDIIQDGNMGLMRAVDLFDGERGWRFSTYAVWWIRQSIHRGIEINARTVRIPGGVLDNLRDIQSEIDAILVAEQRGATSEELGKLIGKTPDAVVRLRARTQHTFSLSSPLHDVDGEDEFEFGSNMAASDDVEKEALDHVQNESLGALLACLTNREQDVMRRRIGADGSRPKTLEEIGTEFNLTRERIRQIEARAITKLQHPCAGLIESRPRTKER